jgi:glyoxylate reductase
MKMAPKTIFITRRIAPEALERLAHLQVNIWEKAEPPPKSILMNAVTESDGLLCLLTDPIDSEVIQAGKHNLKVISQMAVGFDNIDIHTATLTGIPVGHTPGVLTETCADFTFGLIIAISRRIAESDRQVRNHIWKPWGPDVLIGQEIHGSTLGLVGFGRIGQAVAQRAAGFNMKILFADPHPDTQAAARLNAQHVDLHELLEQADFISIHTTLNQDTYHLFNQERLLLMKNTSYLINASRGSIVDPDALLWALENQKIKGAALDVFEPEPIPANHPILKFDNLIITPHIASASIQTRQKMAHMAVENLIAGLEGTKLPYCANPTVYDPQER